MTFTSLEQVDLADIVHSFNTAFADYLVPIQLDISQLQRKIQAENIDLNYSPAAFEGNQLIGLILNATGELAGKKVLYNGGTGIIPAFRGKGLVGQLYDFLKPRLLEEGFDHCLLEVISTNKAAIRAYEKTGFHKIRYLACFKGQAPVVDEKQFPDIQIHPLQEHHYAQLPTFWGFQPTWQHNLATMHRSTNTITAFGLFKKRYLCGYGMIDARSGRIKQFAIHVDFRGRGLGRLLFHHFGRLYKAALTVINVDTADKQTIGFLENLHFDAYLYQHEMKWTLSD